MNTSSRYVASAIAALAVAFTLPAAAAVSSFKATLSNLGEPVPTSPATGSALVLLDDAALTIDVMVSFADLTAAATAGHIHCCTASAGTGSVGVAQGFTGFTGFPSATSGTYARLFTFDAATFASLATGIAAGKAYVNLHSSVHPGGEIRGFLSPAEAIPEPQTYAMLLAGLAVVGAAVRRRSQSV